MKVKWWYIPAVLSGIMILSGFVLFIGFSVNLYTKLAAYRCADIAGTYEAGGEYESAAKWYGLASTLRRGDWEYRYGEAEAWRKLGRWEEALEAYDDVLAVEHPLLCLEYIYVGKAQALAGLGRWDEAVGVYGEAIKPELTMSCGDLCLEAADLFESEWYEVTVGRPLELRPTVWDDGKYVEVLAYLEAAHESEPRHGYPYYLEGRAWLALGQYDKAASCFDVVTESFPDFAPAWERKAWALALTGRYEPALACADTALVLDTYDLDAWNTKGKILLLTGEAVAARGCFNRALARSPSSTEALIGKGITYSTEGKYGEARTYFEGLAGGYGYPYRSLYLYLACRVEDRPVKGRFRPLFWAPPDPWREKIRFVLVGRISVEDLIAEAERRRGIDEYPPASYEPSGITGDAADESLRSSDVITSVVDGYKGDLESVYDKYLRTDPNLEGNLIVRFTVAASGDVTACSVVSSTLGNSFMEQEVCDRIITWRFPPVDEGDVTVAYPFVFFSAGALSDK
ncbi:MAG: TonB family protein [Candidatus Coatesbacteria bacterium]|nr:MAG: TonB family protein [Candidatus Coatesbacteria bacterium]